MHTLLTQGGIYLWATWRTLLRAAHGEDNLLVQKAYNKKHIIVFAQLLYGQTLSPLLDGICLIGACVVVGDYSCNENIWI